MKQITAEDVRLLQSTESMKDGYWVNPETHNEFIVEYKDGSRDWVDPVIDVTEDDEWVYVDNGHKYQYEKARIRQWIVRPYSEETTYLWIGDVK